MIFLLNPWILLTWLGVSMLIGILGRRKRFGFFGNFLVSLLLSPFIGVLMLLASDDRVPVAKLKRN